jgi:flagellar basal-body rod protein FlgF
MKKNNVVKNSLLVLGLVCFGFAADVSVQALNNYEKSYDVMMNNVVNANTPGFRASRIVTSLINNKLIANAVPILDRYGPLVYSGDQFHIAIDGPGFFVLQGPRGFIYTRDARFTLNANNQLVSLSGKLPVYGEGGLISIPPGADGVVKITVSDQGLIMQDNNAVDRLLIVELADPESLSSLNGIFFVLKQTNNLAGNVQHEPLPNAKVRQYYYEGSNVDMAQELVLMPEISKKFDSNSKAIQILKKIKTTGRELGNPQ